jgi:uncharacterized membrane protein YpjA
MFERLQAWLLGRDTLLALIVANAVGTVWGFLWYEDQLMDTPWYFWPLTPDCPLTSFCFLLFLWCLRRKIRWTLGWPAFIAWVAVLGSAKYGIWTVGVIGQYILHPGSRPDAQDWMLIASHVGLWAEGALFARRLPPFPSMYGLAMVWFILNDFADWILMIHPRLPLPGEFPFAMGLSISLTTAVYFWGRWILAGNRKRR